MEFYPQWLASELLELVGVGLVDEILLAHQRHQPKQVEEQRQLELREGGRQGAKVIVGLSQHPKGFWWRLRV